MPRITNVFVWAQFSDASGKFVYNGVVPTADEVIVRQITFSSDDVNGGFYVIHSNLNNGVIGICTNTDGFVSNPQTRIPLRNHPTHLEFQLLAPTANQPQAPGGRATDFIGLSLDFIQN